jgi:Sec-independent protein secretion pathway component TatC
LLILLIPSKLWGYTLIQHLIYTHPAELLIALINLNIFFVLILITPYLIWLIIDFLRPALILNEYKKLLKFYNTSNIIILMFNIFLFSNVFPSIFKFFQSYNSFELNNINIKFELKIIEFLDFNYNIFCLINILLLLLFFLFTVINLKGILFYNTNKKFFIFFNIVIATIISTPDISSQLSIFFFLVTFLEIFQFTTLYKIKLNKASC